MEEGEDEAGEGGKGRLVQQALGGRKKTEGAGGDEAEDGVGGGLESGGLDAEVREEGDGVEVRGRSVLKGGKRTVGELVKRKLIGPSR